MNAQVLYDIKNVLDMSWNIPLYFYFTGLSAGSFILSTLAYVFGVEKFRPLGKLGVVTAFLLLTVAPLFLIFDLADPLLFVRLFWNFNPTSPISWGTVFLTVYPIVCLFYAYYIWVGNMPRAKIFGALGIPSALLVHGYTGWILAAVMPHELWYNPMMPLLFLVSAIVSGIALMIVLMWGANFVLPENEQYTPELFSDMGKLLVGSIAVDLFLVASELLILSGGTHAAQEHVALLTTGAFSGWFVGVELVLGAFIPLALLLVMRKSVTAHVVASLLVMLGILAMRYVVVMGGIYLPIV